MDFKLSTTPLGGSTCLFSLEGGLVASSAQTVKAKLKEAIGEGQSQVVVNMEHVSFLDSSGLSALVSGLKVAREAGGFLKLVALDEQVASIFRLTHLDRVFEIYPDVDSALRG